jgi:hypothetical protein
MNADTLNKSRRQCDGKRRYSSIRFAERVIKRQKRSVAGDLIAYVCQICGGVHIGHRKEEARP